MDATTNASATLELLTWISAAPRTYRETIDVWVSNCPRHSVWDDGISEGVVEIVRDELAQEALVAVTAAGKAVLDSAASA